MTKISTFSASKQRKAGVILQYIQMGLSVLIQLIYTPIMIRILGSTEYGIYNLAASVISYLSLLSLGLGASYIRFYSIYKKDDDYDGIARLNGLYLLTFSLIGIVAFVFGLILANNANIFYNSTYTDEDIYIARVLFALLSLNLALSFPASIFVSFVTSQERFIFQKILNMFKTVVGPAFNIVLLFLGYGSIGMVISTTALSIVIDLVNIIFCFKKLGMKINFSKPNFLLLKDIFTFSIFIAINQIIDQINWQTDKIILGKMISASAVAIYAVGANINTMYTMFSSAISSVFAPKINFIVSKNDLDMDNQLSTIFVRVGRIQWFALTLVLGGFVFFGKYFVYRWVGEGYENSYFIALLLMIPATVPLIQNIGLEIQRAKNKHQFRSIVYLCMAIINVGISIFFVMFWGEIGVAVGTTISLVVANGFVMNFYYHSKLNINIIYFWKSIISTFPSFFPSLIMGLAISKLYSFHSLVDFCILAFLYSIIHCVSVYYVGMNQEEKAIVKTFVKKITHTRSQCSD